MITKRFKIGGFFEFLKIRHVIWKFQFTITLICACIGFPSTILFKVRQKYEDSEYVGAIDKISFYMFMSGVYKDHRHWVQNYFY